jgi:hypothetical protein
MDSNQERMETRIETEINSIQGNIYDGQEDMKAQVGCLACRIDVNQEEMRASVTSSIRWKAR